MRWIWHLRLSDHERLVTNSGFHNLSSRDFTAVDGYLLGLGSSFAVTNPAPSFHSITEDFQEFQRKIRWGDHFQNNPSTRIRSNYIRGFHAATNTSPPTASMQTEAALLELRATLPGIVTACKLRPRKRNLSKIHELAIRSVKNDQKICIANADKNLGTVVLDSASFKNEAMRQLADRQVYLPTDDTADIGKKIKAGLENIAVRHHLSSRDTKCLLLFLPFKPAKFYLLPKIHKVPGPLRHER